VKLYVIVLVGCRPENIRIFVEIGVAVGDTLIVGVRERLPNKTDVLVEQVI